MSKQEYFTEDEILEEFKNNIEYYDENNCFDDLFNDCFNSDYYIIGTYEASEALNAFKNDEFLDQCQTELDGVFGAIEVVEHYEKENFGEINTNIHDPEKLANMVEYIRAETVFNEIIANANTQYSIELSIDHEMDYDSRAEFWDSIGDLQKVNQEIKDEQNN